MNETCRDLEDRAHVGEDFGESGSGELSVEFAFGEELLRHHHRLRFARFDFLVGFFDHRTSFVLDVSFPRKTPRTNFEETSELGVEIGKRDGDGARFCLARRASLVAKRTNFFLESGSFSRSQTHGFELGPEGFGNRMTLAIFEVVEAFFVAFFGEISKAPLGATHVFDNDWRRNRNGGSGHRGARLAEGAVDARFSVI
jgi:hypothetical protein